MIYIILFSLITASLGAIKNVVKYKRFNYKLFVRTPLIATIIYYLLYITYVKIHVILLALLLERWFMFVYKIFIAFINDNYNVKKEKYKLKYGFV